MNNKIIKNSDSTSKTITDFLKSIKENKGVGLTSKEFLFFLNNFNFIETCKNDKTINSGYMPKKKYLKKGLFQYDICEIYKHNSVSKKNYTIKITPKGRNYFMPLVLNLVEIKNLVNTIKTQK